MSTTSFSWYLCVLGKGDDNGDGGERFCKKVWSKHFAFGLCEAEMLVMDKQGDTVCVCVSVCFASEMTEDE
jgi:hypothetical protein